MGKEQTMQCYLKAFFFFVCLFVVVFFLSLISVVFCCCCCFFFFFFLFFFGGRVQENRRKFRFRLSIDNVFPSGVKLRSRHTLHYKSCSI